MLEVLLPENPQSPSNKIELFEEFGLGPQSGCTDCQVIVENNHDVDFSDSGDLELCGECESTFSEIQDSAWKANSAEQCCDRFIDNELIKQAGLNGELAKPDWWQNRVLKAAVWSIRNTVGESHDWIQDDPAQEA